MANEETIKGLKKLRSFHNGSYGEYIDIAIKALEAQPCIEDYPTCTECEHYDKDKHYCPRFCQVIKDTLAEAEDEEVIRVSKGVLKARTGRFVVYDVEYLKKHFYHEEKIYGQPKKGEWLEKDKGIYVTCECSVCGYETDEDTLYCPNCGSLMEVDNAE